MSSCTISPQSRIASSQKSATAKLCSYPGVVVWTTAPFEYGSPSTPATQEQPNSNGRSAQHHAPAARSQDRCSLAQMSLRKRVG